MKKDDLEKPVLEAISLFLSTLEKVDLSKQIEKLKKENLQEDNDLLKGVVKNIEVKRNEINKLKDEVMKVLLGESVFDKNMLSEMITTKEKEQKELIEKKEKIEKKINKKKLEYNDIEILKQSIPLWKEEFELSNLETKKMMINQIIKEVIVFDDKVNVKMKLDFSELTSENFELYNVHKSGHT